jgi:hypothetical protein
MSHLTDKELVDAARLAANVGVNYQGDVVRLRAYILVVLDTNPSPLGGDIIIKLSLDGRLISVQGGI